MLFLFLLFLFLLFGLSRLFVLFLSFFFLRKKENPTEKVFYRILIFVLVIISVVPAVFLSFCFYYRLHPVKTIQVSFLSSHFPFSLNCSHPLVQYLTFSLFSSFLSFQDHYDLIMYTFSWATAACWAGMAIHKTIVSFFPDFYVLLPKAMGRMGKENGTVIWVVFVSLCVILTFGFYLLTHPDEFSASSSSQYPYNQQQPHSQDYQPQQDQEIRQYDQREL